MQFLHNCLVFFWSFNSFDGADEGLVFAPFIGLLFTGLGNIFHWPLLEVIEHMRTWLSASLGEWGENHHSICTLHDRQIIGTQNRLFDRLIFPLPRSNDNSIEISLIPYFNSSTIGVIGFFGEDSERRLFFPLSYVCSFPVYCTVNQDKGIG